MADFGGPARLLILLGVVLVLVGIGISLGPKIPWLGRLPGDFSFGGSGWKVYVPLGTSILVSILMTLVLWLLGKR